MKNKSLKQIQVSGFFGISILLLSLFVGLTLSKHELDENKQHEIRESIFFEVVKPGAMVITLNDTPRLNALIKEAEAEQIDWQSVMGEQSLFLDFLDNFCTLASEQGQGLAHFLAWEGETNEIVFEVGPKFRLPYLFFEIKRVIGTEGRLYSLTPRSGIIKQYCAVKSQNSPTPMLIISRDEHFPLLEAVEFGDFTWLSPSILAHTGTQLKKVVNQSGSIYFDPALESHPELSALKDFNWQSIGGGLLIQITP